MNSTSSENSSNFSLIPKKRFLILFFIIALLLTGAAFALLVRNIYLAQDRLNDKNNIWLIALVIGTLLLSLLAWLAFVRRPFNFHERLLFSINEEAQTAEALRESEMRFRELFENANDIIFTTDLNGNFKSMNKVGEAVTGYARSEALQMNFAQIIAPQNLAFVSRMLTEKLEKGTPTKYETEIITKNGNSVVLDINSTLIIEGGNAIGIQGIARDITESRQANEDKRKSEQYQNLFKHANDAILIFEPESEIILEVNDRACEMYGRRREDFVGRSMKEMSQNVTRGSEKLEKLLHDGIYEEFESVHLRGDGTPLNLVINAAVIEYQGKPAILTINRNVGQRKRMEEELREREQHLLSVANSAQDAIVSADNRGNIIFWNEGARNIFGYEEKEVIGKSLSILMPERYREAQDKEMRRYSETGENRISGRVIELEGLRKDGSEFPLELSRGVWESAKGKYFSGIMRDITERKMSEEKILDSQQWLRAILDASRDGIVIEDEESKIAYINDSYTKLLGYEKPEELVGKQVSDILPPEEAERLMNFGRRRLLGEYVPSVYDFKGKRQNGTLVEVEGAISMTVIGGRKYIMTAVRDVRERKQAEAQLQESEKRFRSFMDNNPAIAFMKDEAGRYVFCNKTMVRMLNINIESLLGRTDFDWLPEDVARGISQSDAKVLSKNQKLELLENMPTPDGDVHRWLTIKFPISDASGKKFIGGMAVDVTERERAEAALRESEYKLRTLLANMSEGLLQVDNNERIEYVNARFCEMTGYEENELLGKITFDIIYDDEGRKFISEANHQRLKGTSGQYEIHLRKKTGERLYTIVGGVPVINADGEVTGTMGVFTDITERKRVEEQLLHDALHDGLTGLANRALFMDHLRLTIQRGKSRNNNPYAVLFLDFDRFKVINDSLGHTEGDNLLEQIARRLESTTRTGDLVARLGGDEFVILLSELLQENDAVDAAERIQNSLKESFRLKGQEVYISASIGIALSTAGHESPEDMLRDADIAMYRAKSKGRAQHQVFDRRMHEQAAKQLSLETEMRHALEREEFQIHYQPIMNLKNESLIGFESLVRWKHPERGTILPFEFIGTAEENGLILPLGAWILQESCRQLRHWQTAHPAAAHLTVSVNLSSKQFSQLDFAEQIAGTLEWAKLDPRCLKLEITESHIMENSEQAVVMMNRLRALGVELSLDDFGTGYSSLSYLHRLPASYLKIDRSFVMRMAESEENSEIVSTIIKLAQNLKMEVIAEGVETVEQLTHLKNLNCEFGQGYFFSKPLETEAAEKFIEVNLRNSSYQVNQPIINLELNT